MPGKAVIASSGVVVGLGGLAWLGSAHGDKAGRVYDAAYHEHWRADHHWRPLPEHPGIAPGEKALGGTILGGAALAGSFLTAAPGPSPDGSRASVRPGGAALGLLGAGLLSYSIGYGAGSG